MRSRTLAALWLAAAACGGAKDTAPIGGILDTGPPLVDETIANDVCNDGLDNDEDGAADCADTGCAGAFCTCAAFADAYVACVTQTGITADEYADHSVCVDATDADIPMYECLKAAYSADCSTNKALFEVTVVAAEC